MIYNQTINRECIVFHPLNDEENIWCVEMTRYGDIPMFSVYMDDGTEEWNWEFEMFTPSDYDRVKLCIFNAVEKCETMLELACVLDSFFRDDFADILIEEGDDECNGCDCYCDCHMRYSH